MIPNGARAAMAAHLEGVAAWWRIRTRQPRRRRRDARSATRPRRDRRQEHGRRASVLRRRSRPPRPVERGDRVSARPADVRRRGQRLPPARRAARRELADREPGSRSTARAFHHVCFGVDDVEQAVSAWSDPGSVVRLGKRAWARLVASSPRSGATASASSAPSSTASRTSTRCPAGSRARGSRRRAFSARPRRARRAASRTLP